MKRMPTFLILLMFLISSAFSQEIIENTKNPLNPNAGRVLKIEEVFRISDGSGEFYFKYPKNLKISPDGTIFISDENQFLKFDENGNFKQNFFKKGQGPGEFTYIGNYCLNDEKIIIYNNTPNKLVWLDFDGKLLNEYTIPHNLPSRLDFVVFYNGYYFIKSEFPYTEGKFVPVDSPQILLSISESEDKLKELISFPIKLFAIGSKGQGAGMFRLSKLIISPFKEKFLFVSHSGEYLIKLYDMENEKIIRSFKRDYKRVKPPKDYSGGKIGFAGKSYSPPRPDYLNDINNLFVLDGLLWVQTSTKDEDKGYLIDVYDFDGKFIDSFFINLKGSLLATDRDSIFALEKDENELLSIVKYKLLEKSLFP